MLERNASPTRRPARPLRRRLSRTFLLLAAALAIFLGVLLLSPFPKPKPLWTAADHTPPPGDFLYAMFPVNNTVDLLAAPKGSPVGTLRRAVVNSQEEIDSGGWFRVNGGASATWVRPNDLRYIPPSNADTDYFDAFDVAYRLRAPNELRSATLKLSAAGSGVTTATLHLRPDDDHVEIYVYQISSGRATPLELTRYFGPAMALMTVGHAIGAGIASVAFLIIAAFVTDRRR